MSGWLKVEILRVLIPWKFGEDFHMYHTNQQIVGVLTVLIPWKFGEDFHKVVEELGEAANGCWS